MEPDPRPTWESGMPECSLEHCPAYIAARCCYDARIVTAGGNVYCQRAIERMRDTLIRVAGVVCEDDADDCLEAAGEVPP